MLKIAHRGNLNGPNPNMENHPDYILNAIKQGYHVEIDLRQKDGQLYLGHDEPQYKIDKQFIIELQDYLWIHCKDIESLMYCAVHFGDANYFWHQQDDYTITSRGNIWVYPGCRLVDKNTNRYIICVLPEVDATYVKYATGICTDHINII
ncbi:MAG TPA: hypothetical protein VLG50_05910 [Candidatus Saccharimonadales bacterium]|nr:hypothetical protein [Candidatus Saccharimonadales bacterium]